MILLNLIPGTLVTTIGFWILWNAALPVVLVGWALVVSGCLWWNARSVTEVWARVTLVLGLESLAWPFQRMIQFKSEIEAPSPEEMGAILSDIILGVFFSVFWMTFSVGLFKWAWKVPVEIANNTVPAKNVSRTAKRNKGR